MDLDDDAALNICFGQALQKADSTRILKTLSLYQSESECEESMVINAFA